MVYRKIFLVLLHRQFLVFFRDIKSFIFNAMFLTPLWLILGGGYFVPLQYFGGNNHRLATILFIGSISVRVLMASFSRAADFTVDRVMNGYLSYQLSYAPLWLVLAVRIVAYGVITSLSLVLFFPLAKLILGAGLVTSSLSWVTLYSVLFMGSFALVAYLMALMAFLSDMSNADQVWVRGIEPALLFGGFWVPWQVVFKIMPLLSSLVLLTPVAYLTEGIRASFFPHDGYLSAVLALLGLLGATGLYAGMTYFILKKRLDVLS